VFTIPRVGKSVEMDRREVEEDEYNFTSQDDLADDDNNDNNDNLRSTDAQRRNVFSKIPRVGRSRVGRSRGDRRPWSSSYVGPNDTF